MFSFLKEKWIKKIKNGKNTEQNVSFEHPFHPRLQKVAFSTQKYKIVSLKRAVCGQKSNR